MSCEWLHLEVADVVMVDTPQEGVLIGLPMASK
jgi:hypothetical protein